MEVAVFGGSGFLGKYLTSELGTRGYQVTVFDKDSSKFPKDKGNTVFHETDILDRNLVFDQIQEGKFDIVFNLAGFANLDDAIKDPLLTMQLNVCGNINLLDASINAHVKRFLYASSAYAMSNKGSFYGISKLTSEKIIEEYNIKFGLPFTILRYGSVYSQDAFNNNYIYNLIERAITTKKIIHGGDGDEIREYIHASDAAKLSVDVVESQQFENSHVVFTGTEKMKRSDLFRMINEIHGDDIEIILNEGEYHNHYRFTPYSYSPTLSKKLVANPHIDMGQGILECIKAVYLNSKDGDD